MEAINYVVYLFLLPKYWTEIMDVIVQAIIISYFMRINESADNVGVSLLYYLGSTMFIVMAPAFTVSKEDVQRLTLE